MQIVNSFLLHIIPIISPTYLITDLLKNNNRTKKNKELKRRVIKRISNIYLSLAWLSFGFLLLWPYFSKEIPFLSRIIFFLIGYFAISRTTEIFIVFLVDGKQKMENKPKAEEGLTYADRYMLALKSYLELILNYGMIYYALNTNYVRQLFAVKGLFNTSFSNVFEAVYFSANNITIAGYGDIFPIHFLSQFFSVFQVLTGVFLLIITFTIYVTLNFTDEQNLNPKPESEEIRRAKRTPIQILSIIFIIITGIIEISKHV